MINATSSGSFKKTLGFLTNLQSNDAYSGLDAYGRMGVTALANATPKRSGRTANSWTYEIEKGKTETTITWLNTNNNNGSNIAILLQYGHGTGTGGYVAGYDYINPAIRPIFDKIADDVWGKIQSS